MNLAELHRLVANLDGDGHVLTSFDALGLPHYEPLATEVLRAVQGTDQFKESAHGNRSGMLMFREAQTLDLGRQLVAPVFGALFSGAPEAAEGFGMYCVNHYEGGNTFKPHQDYFDGTIVIVTTCGERRFAVYEKHDDDVFVGVQRSYVLRAGSIMLLNGYMNLGHAAECTVGPSLSIVADVPSPIVR